MDVSLDDIFLCPSATKFTERMRDGVVVCGSHGGRYPGVLAAQAGLRAVILCDAGVGLEDAGIASLSLLEGVGMAAATVSSVSCRIGDADDMADRGIISYVNSVARKLGVTQGQKAIDAGKLMTCAPKPYSLLDLEIHEVRAVQKRPNGRDIILIDSASLVEPTDAGQVIVTGSHGGLVGGVPAMALQVGGHAALFNDAGVGAENAGISRLAALDSRAIAAATVYAATARIGDARSTLDRGIISHCNSTAAKLGCVVGMSARHFVEMAASQ